MKRDIQTEITNAIVEAIEAGAAKAGDWVMPWHQGAVGAMPENATTGRRYRGINVPWLWFQADKRGYASNQWATFKQWKDRGASVRKGEKAVCVVFWKWFDVEDKDSGETVQRPVLRHYNVFNAEQVDGYDAPAVEAEPVKCLAERLDAAETFVERTGAVIHHRGNQAFHANATNEITIPKIEAFIATENATATENYYSTLFHELTHWTRVEKRLNRDFGRKRWGDEGYAMEELVAELGAAFLCSELGVSNSPRPDHAQYIASWLTVLKRDSRAIITAAAHAQKAVDYLAELQGEDGPTDRPPRGTDKPTAEPAAPIAPAAPQAEPAAAPVAKIAPAPAAGLVLQRNEAGRIAAGRKAAGLRKWPDYAYAPAKRKRSLAWVRKNVMAQPYPVYVATFADGLVKRFSFSQQIGKPWDWQECQAGATWRYVWHDRVLWVDEPRAPVALVAGHIEHDGEVIPDPAFQIAEAA